MTGLSVYVGSGGIWHAVYASFKALRISLMWTALIGVTADVTGESVHEKRERPQR